jgi:hypothetical protein
MCGKAVAVAAALSLIWTAGPSAGCDPGEPDPLDDLAQERSTVERELAPAVPPSDQQELVRGGNEFSPSRRINGRKASQR